MVDRRPVVVCVGLATLDVIGRVDRLPGTDERVVADAATTGVGGGAAIAAVALARLGVPVAFVGRVGDDDAGRRIQGELAAEGVDVRALRTAGRETPFSIVLVEAGTGARSIVPWRGDLGALDLDAVAIELCADAAWVHSDHVGFAGVRGLRRDGANPRLSLDAGNPIADLRLDAVDLFAPTEAALLARQPGLALEDALLATLNEGPSVVVATRGAKGSAGAIREPNGAARIVFAPVASGPTAPIVSTLGAGDVFHGALLAALVDGRDLAAAMQFANVAAALSCRALDGRSAIPTRVELEAHLEAALERGGAAADLEPTAGAATAAGRTATNARG